MQKPFALIASFVVMTVIGYIVYMIWQAQRVPPAINIASSMVFIDAPPMVCQAGNKAHTVGGTIKIFNDAARFDLKSNARGSLIDVHIIVNREGTGYVWVEGDAVGTYGSYDAVYGYVGLASLESMVCSPWWIPDGGLFIVPQNVTFSDRI